MKLNYIVKTKEELPKGREEDYIEQEDGSFLLDVEGVKTFTEYQETYDALQTSEGKIKELNESLEKFGEYTPEKIEEILGELKEAKAAVDEGTDPSEIQKKAEEIAQYRTKELKEQLESLTSEKDEALIKIKDLNASILASKLESKLRDITKDKIIDSAFDDIKLRAEKAGLVYRDDKQDFYHPTAGKNLEEWAGQEIENNVHWHKSSESGGARGGSGVNNDGSDDSSNIFEGVFN